MSPVRVLSQFAEHQAYILAARRFLPGKSLTIDLHQSPSTPALGRLRAPAILLAKDRERHMVIPNNDCFSNF